MLTILEIKEKVAELSPAINQENYHQIALQIHPIVILDKTLAEILASDRTETPERREYIEAQNVAVSSEWWTDMVVYSVTLWQYAQATQERLHRQTNKGTGISQ